MVRLQRVRQDIPLVAVGTDSLVAQHFLHHRLKATTVEPVEMHRTIPVVAVEDIQPLVAHRPVLMVEPVVQEPHS